MGRSWDQEEALILRGLNVGSGQRPFASTSEIEWCNVDKVVHEGMPAPDLVCDGAHLPYGGSQADYFVLHHCLEHEGLNEGNGLISEAWRVLRPGGSILVFVPDLRALARGLIEGKIDTITYAITIYGAYMGHEADRHRFGYDYGLLSECLAKCSPWREVKKFDWRKISGADIAQDWWILGVEAIK